MLKMEIYVGQQSSIMIMDSITKATEDDVNRVVISASHGGRSSGEFALEHSLDLVLFNDAGDGKDHAGTSALEMLHDAGRAAATIAHTSARIGDALDHWESGVISAVNDEAASRGIRVGDRVQDATKRWVDAPIGGDSHECAT